MHAALRRKLTVFTPPQPSGFPDPAHEEALSDARTMAYEEGYRAGRLEAEQEAEDSKARLDQTVAEMADQLNRIVMEVENSHQRSIKELLGVALPALAETAAAAEITSIIVKAAGSRLAGGLQVTAHQKMAQQLAAHLEKVALLPPVKIIPDKECDELAVQLSWQDGGAEIDIGAAVKACLNTLTPEADSPEGGNDHGQ